MSYTNQFTRLGLAAVLGALLQGAAFAEVPLSDEALSTMAPQDRQTYLAKLIARQRANPGPMQGDNPDSVAPVLTAFNAGTKLNLGKAASPFAIAIKATDDSSGLRNLNFFATGPSGQVISGAIDPAFPSTSFAGYGGFGAVSQFLQPGVWKFTSANGRDWANNSFSVDEAGLAALGNTTFTVVNAGGYDLVQPSLTSGKLITGTVSLSAVAKGTSSEDPFVGVRLTTADTGTGAVAGVKSVAALFCQLVDPSKCFLLSGATTATGLAALTLNAKAQVSVARGNVTGDYTLNSVTVQDHAGNLVTLTSTLFGGATDFSAIFPGALIKLTP